MQRPSLVIAALTCVLGADVAAPAPALLSPPHWCEAANRLALQDVGGRRPASDPFPATLRRFPAHVARTDMEGAEQEVQAMRRA